MQDTVDRWAEADALHTRLVKHTEALMGCLEGSEEEIDLAIICEALDIYERKRWPEGQVPGGKG